MNKIKERYKHVPEVKKIVGHKILPKPVLFDKRTKATMANAKLVKKVRIMNHYKRDIEVKDPLVENIIRTEE